LSRHEQNSARAQLRKLGLMQEQLRGSPARMYYRVDMNRLGQILSGLLKIQNFTKWDWQNSAQVMKLLGRPIGFYTKIAKAMESASASLLVSYLMFAQKSAITTAHTADWLSPNIQWISDRLGLTYKVQLRIRKELAELGVIDQKQSQSMNPQPLIRLRFTRMLELLTAQTGKNQHESIQKSPLQSSGVQVMPKPANWNLPFRQTGNAQTGKQEMPESANRECPNQRSSLPEREVSIYTYTDTTTTTGKPSLSAVPAQVEQAHSSGGSGIDEIGKQENPRLDFGSVEADYHPQASALLKNLEIQLQQQVADEWVARMTQKDAPAIKSPFQYLKRLVSAAKAGTFVLEKGIAVAKARRLQSAVAIQIAQSSKPQTPQAETTTGMPAEEKEKINKLIREMKSGLSGAGLKSKIAGGVSGTHPINPRSSVITDSDQVVHAGASAGLVAGGVSGTHPVNPRSRTMAVKTVNLSYLRQIHG
jgi:hypothetical protein